MGACPFCAEMLAGQRVIVREKLVWALPTNLPIVPMHTLVIPIRHIETLGELSADERSALLDLALRLADVFRRRFDAEGFNFAWNEGELAGQGVSHLHLHVVPRKRGDKGIIDYDPRKFLYRPGSREQSPDAELRGVAEQIRAALT